MDTTKNGNRDIVCMVADGTFDFVCPICGYSKRLMVGDRRGRLIINCRCKNRVGIILNRRGTRRCRVSLSGYINIGNKEEINIEDVSLGGLGVATNNLYPDLDVGDEIELVFFANYKGENRRVEVRTVVRSITDGGKIGLEFASPLEECTLPFRVIRWLSIA